MAKIRDPQADFVQGIPFFQLKINFKLKLLKKLKIFKNLKNFLNGPVEPFEWLISLEIVRIPSFSDNWPGSNRPSSQTGESFNSKTEKNRTSHGGPQFFIFLN